jgi:tryptophan halogenase
MNEHSIRNVVIVGGGTAGWMTAAAFSRFLNNGYTNVTLIESEEIGTIGVGEATIPPLIRYNQMIGLNENQFLAETNGTIKLGIEFVDWGGLGERYIHPFGNYAQDLQGVHFHQLYLRERKRRVMPDISAWSMSAVAASMGRFARPSPDARSPVREMFYAFHFDASLYAQLLRRLSESRGIKRIEGKVADVSLRPEDGYVEAVTLADGQRIEGDLFIDCSGFRGLLIEGALQTGYEPYRKWLPCDRAIAVPSGLPGEPDPFTRATAHANGWQWRIPLQHRIGSGLVYSSDFQDDDSAEQELLDSLDGPPLATPQRIRFTSGRRNQSWNRNVVSIGLAGGFIEPLESTGIHLIQSGIARLISLFPDKRFNPVERDEYNRQMRDLYEDIRDFIVLHYKATNRNDSEFWNHCRTMEIPESLSRKIELFRAKGRLFRDNLELFGNTSWIAVCLGQHIIPEEHEPAADALEENSVAEALEQIRRGYWETAQQLPTHAEFLRRCAPAQFPGQQAAPRPSGDMPFFSFAEESPFPTETGSPV